MERFTVSPPTQPEADGKKRTRARKRANGQADAAANPPHGERQQPHAKTAPPEQAAGAAEPTAPLVNT